MLWAAMAIVGLFATGCNKSANGPEDENAPTGVTNEQSARLYFANNDEFVNNDEQSIDDQEVQPTDYGTFGKIDAAITPLRWGRFVRNVSRTATDTVYRGDSIAVVHIRKVITGVLKIRAINGAGDTVLIDKPFTDAAERNIIFRRFGRETKRFWLNWLPVAISLVDGGTVSPSNINITKLEIITPNDTITITDPLSFYLRFPARRILHTGRMDVPEFVGAPRVIVKATVVSSSPDTDLVALRFGMDPLHKRRIRMQCVSRVQVGSNYEGVFQAPAFQMHVFPGAFHIAVDALTRETLFDDQAPYSVSWWGFPYRVR
jgi:hypothetical protein